ncbi:helix-turn-helix domain-containing protein [Pseudomonas sp. NFX71]|uniref:helix-turn-helix domain-containing protein n=1 Tax=Pseudomonas sp. NFX71 TaxID=3399121 RepID=UPI003A86D3BE
MSFILPTLHRQAAKEVGVQTESFHAPTFPEARSGERVLYLRVSESTDLLGSAQCHRLPGGWEGLIAVSEALQMRGGCVQVLPLSETRLVKLQVFFDLSDTLTEQRPGHAPWALLPVTYETVRSERALERWYIGQAMSASPAYHAFASVLRHTESYGLVRFLLEQGTRSEKLSDLAQRYGVSVSHFRRLCRQALGSAAKPALRGWRTAQALLNMSLRDCSLTDVALEFGFASSSHFSKEIRELVGFTPSSLADITYLPGK